MSAEKQLEQARNETAALLASLHPEVQQAVILPVLKMRLDLLTNTLLPEGTDERTKFELDWEREYAKQLREVVPRSTLVTP